MVIKKYSIYKKIVIQSVVSVYQKENSQKNYPFSLWEKFYLYK